MNTEKLLNLLIIFGVIAGAIILIYFIGSIFEKISGAFSKAFDGANKVFDGVEDIGKKTFHNIKNPNEFVLNNSEYGAIKSINRMSELDRLHSNKVTDTLSNSVSSTPISKIPIISSIF